MHPLAAARQAISGAFLAMSRRVAVREAAGCLVDDDDHLYRPLSAGAAEDTASSEMERSRYRRVAKTFYFRNPVGGALVDTLVARVVGAGVQWVAEDESVQEVIDRFAADPDNDLDLLAPRLVAELLAYGEVVLPIFLTPKNADVRLGYLLPEQVERIIWRTGDAKKPLAVLQRRAAIEDAKRLWIIPHPAAQADNRYPPHPALTQEDEAGSVPGVDGLPVVVPDDPAIIQLLQQGDVVVAGYAFYHRTGCLVSGRGRGLYERASDWLHGFDDWFFGVIRNAVLQGAFVWDVTLTNADDQTVRQRAKEITTPPQGAVLVHNDKEQWQALTPDLPGGAQLREVFTGILKLIGLGAGIPGHELGAEDDTNRATAQESRSVSINRAKRLQREVVAMLCTWVGYLIDQKVHAQMLPGTVSRAVEFVLPELDVRDEQAQSATLKATVEACTVAIDAELMLPDDARTAVYRALGMDAPSPEDFQRAMDEERQRRDEAFMARAEPKMRALIDQINRAGAGAPVAEEEPEP